jgi:hypothetical protein
MTITTLALLLCIVIGVALWLWGRIEKKRDSQEDYWENL